MLEILKYYGRDVNILEMFDKFKDVHRDDDEWWDAFTMPKDKFNSEMRDMFEDALH